MIQWLMQRLDVCEGGMQEYARTAFEFLCDKSQLGLPSDFPLLCPDQRSRERHWGLLVHVGHKVSWPLALPFDHWTDYPKAAYGGLSRYEFVDWILSGRTFSSSIRDRLELDRALQDRVAFLRSSFFIVNHGYSHWKDEARRRVNEAVELIREVGGAFNAACRQDGGGDLALNLVFNPSAEDVDGILRNVANRVIFADFHTKEGCWVVCPEDAPHERLDLAKYRPGKVLRHVALLSVSHCSSVRDPTVPTAVRSICQTLLDAGVRRTSGSIVEECAVDYFCRLLFFFCHARALGPVLFQACLLADVDLDDLLSRTNRFLAKMGFPEADRNATIV